MFSKIGASAIKKDIFNTIKLCEHLGNPHKKFKSIHVAGTNGKGSVSHMLAAVLQSAGYKTGLYTSPHLRDFRERIRINGQMISEAKVVAFVSDQREIIEEIEPSFFEVTVAMAFQYFEQEKVDIAVIEVGLGGRLDSTNIISPLLSVITNIGYDHMNILGNTLTEIAFEKAGIIKQETPVVVGERQREVENVFIKKAEESSSSVVFASDEWSVSIQALDNKPKDYLTLPIECYNISVNKEIKLDLDLTGSYQLKNVATVLSGLELLRSVDFEVSSDAVKSGLSNVKSMTGLKGRWDILSTCPMIVCDTGHNEHGIKEVVRNLEASNFRKLHMVFGMVQDKDVRKVLSQLPKHAIYYFCQPQIERAKPAIELAEEAVNFDLVGSAFTTVQTAFEAAKKAASEDDFIFVGGSTFVVAEVI